MTNFAWVTHENNLYWVSETEEQALGFSAVQSLIFNIFEIKHDLSFFILRNQIHTTLRENPYDHAAVKLTAKKIKYNESPEAFQRALGSAKTSIHLTLKIGESVDYQKSKMTFEPQIISEKNEVVQFIENLKQKIPTGPVLHDYNRQIVAVLVNGKGEILFANSNFNYRNKILHAEVNLMNSYFEQNRKPVPDGCKVYVSLKPCRMCANILHQSCELGVKIFYLTDDTGKLARGSLIESRLTAL